MLEDRLEASTARLDEAYGELLVRLAWAAEYRDDVTGQHAERVARLCGLIALELGRPRRGRRPHRAGVAPPRPGQDRRPRLHPPQARHPHAHRAGDHAAALRGGRRPPGREPAPPPPGGRARRPLPPRAVGRRRLPDGLRRRRIPLAARITAVADAFDSLTQARPYRPAIRTEEALVRIMEDRGSHFDPTVVDALLELHDGQLEAAGRTLTAGEWKGPGRCCPEPDRRLPDTRSRRPPD
jgi:putative two-component system response regulator